MNKIYDIDTIIQIYNYISYSDKLKFAHTSKYLYDIFWLYLEKTIILNNENTYFLELLKKNIRIDKLIVNTKKFDSTILLYLKKMNKLKYIKIENISKKIIDFRLFPQSIEYIELGNNRNDDYYYIICPIYFYTNKKNDKIIEYIKTILPNIKTLKLYGNIYDYVNLLKIVI